MKHSNKKSFDWYSMQQRYSIRKYHFGAASVLLGTALVLGTAANAQSVQAEEQHPEATNSVSVDKVDEATKPAEVSTPKKETTYAAPTVANPVETIPAKSDEAKAPAEKVEEVKDKKEEVTQKDAVDKSKLLTALSRAKKLESKLYTEASAANLQASIQAGQGLLGKADATEAEISAAESSIQSAIIGLELRSNSDKGTVSETPVVKKTDTAETKEEAKSAATTTDRSAVDSSVLATNAPAKVETTSAPASTNEILKPGLSLSDARQNPAIRKEDLDRGYSGFRTAGSGFRAAGSGFRAARPENKPILNPGNAIAFSDISQGSHSFRGIGHSRGGQEIHYDVTTVRSGNRIDFTINYSAPGDSREFVNNNFILDKGTGFGEPSSATVSTRYGTQTRNIGKGANFISHSGYSMNSAVETNAAQMIRFTLPITNPNGDLSLRLRPVEFNVDQGGGGAATSNDPYSNSNYYYETDPLYLDANPNPANVSIASFKSKVDFQTLYIPTTKLAEGVTELVSEGKEGEKSQDYRLHKFGDQYVLGLPVGDATIVTAAKPRVMKYGIGKIAATQNKTGDTNHIKFYLDKDGDGVFNNQDELILNTDIKDGERGPAGPQGPVGPTGAQGQRGPAGPAGPKGADGQRGPAGPAGPQGPVGPTGAQGQRGPAGPQGSAGPAGAPGQRGPAGPAGPAGATGAQGPAGAPGQRGPAGPQGPAGPKGADGKSLIAVKNGTETKIYVENPASPGQPLNPSQPLATITDGRNGTNGQSPTITAARSVQNGKNGVLVTITPVGGQPQTTFVEDGQKGADGKTPTVTITDGQNGTHTLTVHNPGSPDATTIIRDGQQGPAGVQGPVGPKGEDGKTPTVKVTDGQDGTHTITINDGKGGITTTVVRDGFDGASPLVSTHRNEVDKTTTVIFYYDQNENNQFDAGDTKLKEVVIADGKQGPKGDKGENGEVGPQGPKGADGKEVLNGKANPQPADGKDGDTFVNTQTGDVFVKKGDTWEPAGNIKGPKGDKGENGEVGPQGPKGEDGKTPEVTVTPGKDGNSSDITFTVPGKDPVRVNVKNGENGLNGKTPKVDLLRVEGQNGNPSHTIVTFYTDENGDGKYTPGTDELLGSEMIKDGAKGVDGRDGKSLITVKDGNETKVYQEDPANPGQPLNPEKPLAVIRDGVDGKSPTVTAVRKEDGNKGVEITVDNHDGSQPTTVFVQDGAKGETGAAGRNGSDVLSGNTPPKPTDGKDGDSYVDSNTGEVYKKENGTWNSIGNIKGPKGDKGDTPEITTKPGADGKSTDVTITVPGKDPVTVNVKDGKDGKDGKSLVAKKEGNETKIYVEDPANPGQPLDPTKPLATVLDGLKGEKGDKGENGADGKSPTVNVTDNGDGTHSITVRNPDGSESTTKVKDGKDGKTATITTTDNQDGSYTITVTNPDGTSKETVIRNGKDGKTPKVEVTDNNNGTHTIKVTDGDGNVTNATIKDGKDGKSATAETTENADGSHTVTITNPDGTKKQFIVKNGRDGEDGRTPTASVRDNPDGSHTIIITNPQGVTTETTVRDGKSPKVTITDEQNGTHKISVLNGDGTTTETIVKDGKSPVATVKDNKDGTYTIRVENGNGTVSETTVRDGKSPTAKVVDNGDGTHTVTIVNSDGTTTTTTVRDGKSPKLEIIDNKDGSHTVKVTGADGKEKTTTIFDGKSPKAKVVDNGDGTHTLTIVDSDGMEYTSIIKDGKDGKDGKSPTVSVKNNNDGTHVVTITNPDGSVTEMVIKDGKDGKSPKVTVKNNGNGTHTIIIVNSDGTITETVVKDGKDGRDGKDGKDGRDGKDGKDGRDGKDGKDGNCGCSDKPEKPTFAMPVPPVNELPEYTGGVTPLDPPVYEKPEFNGGVPGMPEVTEKPELELPEIPTPPVHEVPEFNGGVPGTPEVTEVPELKVPEVPVQPTPEKPITPNNGTVPPTTEEVPAVNVNQPQANARIERLAETGEQGYNASIYVGGTLLFTLYLATRRKDDQNILRNN